MNAEAIKAAFISAGFRVEIYSGKPGILVRVLGERQDTRAADRLAGEHGVTWVSEAQTPERIASWGYPNIAA